MKHFQDWLMLLRFDATITKEDGLYGRLQLIPEPHLEAIYQEAVKPKIGAVIAWCEEDPERCKDRQYWKSQRMPQGRPVRRSGDQRTGIAA